jgi:hypothetical protein
MDNDQLNLFPASSPVGPSEDLGPNPLINPYAAQFVAPRALSKDRDAEGLDGRERYVVDAVLAGSEASEAASMAGYPRVGMGREVLTRPHVRSALRAELDRVGLTETRIAEKINEGLDAQRAVVCDKSIDMVPDHSAQHRYLTTLLELRGDLKSEASQEESWETVLFAVRSRRSARSVVDDTEDPMP